MQVHRLRVTAIYIIPGYRAYIICFSVFLCCVSDRFGKIEGVKILPQRYPNIGVAAFIDFYSVQSAIEAKEAKHKISGCDIRTNFKSKPTEKFDATQRKWQENLSTEKPEKRDKSRGHERYNEREGMHSSARRFASLCAHNLFATGGVLYLEFASSYC